MLQTARIFNVTIILLIKIKLDFFFIYGVRNNWRIFLAIIFIFVRILLQDCLEVDSYYKERVNVLHIIFTRTPFL